MVAKSQIKYVASLKQKKYRNRYGLFVVEGKKLVMELLQAGLTPYWVFVDASQNATAFQAAEVVSSSAMQQMSSLRTPNGVLGVFYIPKPKITPPADWVVALDAVRDPGNLGTIIRLCDWFGIPQLLCSKDTVDCYNPKVLQATMGSIARVTVTYVDLYEYIQSTELPVYGACVQGKEVYNTPLPENGILVLGSEAHGISEEIEAQITQRIAIPQFGGNTAESLNVATATAILLSEIRRLKLEDSW